MGHLAIKGHATRGKEVIEILEMLGGINTAHSKGVHTELAYYIEVNRSICCIDFEFEYHTGFYKITLEEFLEKFPYKVGDRVKNVRINDFIGRIKNVRWDDSIEQVVYVVEWDDITKSTLTYFARDLQPYKEETMDKVSKAVFDVNTQCCDIMNHLIKEKIWEKN